MRKKLLYFGAWLMLLCLLVNAMPISVGATEGAVTYDFNNVDFDTVYQSGTAIGSDSAAILLSDTSSVPAGFTNGVCGGGSSSYSAIKVDFEEKIDLTKVTAFKVRMFVPNYAYTSNPCVRLLNTGSTSDGYTQKTFVGDLNGAFGVWCEVDLLEMLNNPVITKDSNGYLDKFIIGYRCYSQSEKVTCYYDSIIIEYADDFFVNNKNDETDDSEITLQLQTNISAAQDGSGRYLLYFDGIKDTSNIYWDNNIVYIDGNARTGEGVNYAVLDGMLGLCLKYQQVQPGATSASEIGEHLLHIKAGTLISSGQYTVVNDVWIKLDGYNITLLESVTLTYARGSVQDDEGNRRYLLRFDGLTDTSNIYWDNNTVYIDDEAKNGDGVNYAVLDGQLALCLKYDQIEEGVTTAMNLSKHILTIKSGTMLAGKYVLNNTIIIELDGNTITLLNTPDITVKPENDSERNGTNCTQGVYFTVSPVDDLAYTSDWKTRYHMDTGSVYVNGISVPSAELIKISGDLYYIAFDYYLGKDEVFTDGTVITISGTVTAEDYTVEYETTSFEFDTSIGWSEIDYNMPVEDIVICLDDENYVVTEKGTRINEIEYTVGDVYTTVGTHTLSYKKSNYNYECNLIVYRIGDANDSDSINVCDLIAMKKRISKQSSESASRFWGADIDSNNVIDNVDLSFLRKILLQADPILPLSPAVEVTVAHASNAVENLMTDYDLTAYKADKIKTGEDLYHRDEVVLRWKKFSNASEVQVMVGTKGDLTDAVTYTTAKNNLTLRNLVPNETYYWKVYDGSNFSAVQSFMTADTIRTISIDGVSNTRDLGGYIVSSGERVKYGMVYRGANIDGITETGKGKFLNELGITTDLDLRGGYTRSPLGEVVTFYSFAAPWYWNSDSGLLADSYQVELAKAIGVFADESNYPIYFHCAIGRDRTGTLSMLINGLLGVCKEDLYLDYEMSFLSRSGAGDSATAAYMVGVNFAGLYEGVQSYAPDGTFADACEAYMLSIGVTQNEVDSIRELMLESY